MKRPRSDRRSRVDTRGLPPDLDPRYFYEYRYMIRSKEAQGIEGLILKYMPYSVVRSFAFALDVDRQFKVSPERISPKNRKVTKVLDSVLNRQVWSRRTLGFYTASTPNYQDIPGRWGPTRSWSTSSSVSGSSALYARKWTRHDTTDKTRLVGSSKGELELFKYTVNAPVKITRRYDIQYRHLPILPSGVFPEINDGTVVNVTHIEPGAYAPSTLPAAVESLEKSYCSTLISNHRVSMFAATNPQHRTFSFFRELVELRDLPRTILSMKGTAQDLARVYNSFHDSRLRDKVFSLSESVRDIPKEYLSYHFGWKLLVKSIDDLLSKPEKTAKRISLLIRRSGKATTYRTKRKFTSSVTAGVPNLSVGNQDPAEFIEKTESRIERQSELRMVINTTFDFPSINPVSFASRMFYDQLGVNPRPTDLYNLVPWSWLFDWFTGTGDYINVIDEINRDRSLINWGMITAVTRGVLTTTSTSRYTDRETVQVTYGNTGVTTNITRRKTYSATLDYSYQMRVDLGSIAGVRKITDVSSLTSYQQSILGALLSERSRKWQR